MPFLQIFGTMALIIIIVVAIGFIVLGTLYKVFHLILKHMPEWCVVIYVAAVVLLAFSSIIYFSQ
ncbi:hypothetical protein [Sporosarcina psychrophila]|uniref:Uncharacterized membrane protein (DUF106 family) n=1 Tax=Sporosarcina psychrophila TaxID=1476 RepID=A0ABV2KBK4_SPOPS